MPPVGCIGSPGGGLSSGPITGCLLELDGGSIGPPSGGKTFSAGDCMDCLCDFNQSRYLFLQDELCFFPLRDEALQAVQPSVGPCAFVQPLGGPLMVPSLSSTGIGSSESGAGGIWRALPSCWIAGTCWTSLATSLKYRASQQIIFRGLMVVTKRSSWPSLSNVVTTWPKLPNSGYRYAAITKRFPCGNFSRTASVISAWTMAPKTVHWVLGKSLCKQSSKGDRREPPCSSAPVPKWLCVWVTYARTSRRAGVQFFSQAAFL